MKKGTTSIWFDWGNVLLPIDVKKTDQAFRKLGAKEELRKRDDIFHPFEKGEISSAEFVRKISKAIPKATHSNSIKDAWNQLLQPFPPEHFNILKKLKNKYQLILVSNTNEIHVHQIQQMMGRFDYSRFLKCFDKTYLSFEMGKRKPDLDFFESILTENSLAASDCLLIDDTKENLITANSLGMKSKEFNLQDQLLKDAVKEWKL